MASSPAGRRILKVHELMTAVRETLEGTFSDLWIEGEVADLTMPQSGHLYFNLKDSRATIKAVVFRSHLRFLRFRPKAGKSVLIRGRLNLYEARGSCQLICDYLEPRGAGALQAAFERLKAQLRQEGLFDPDRKRPMPRYPARIGLITSASGAAIQDILKVFRESAFPCHLLLHPVPVQGWDAAEKISAALDTFNRPGGAFDASMDLLILARGGGSPEDLRAFNEECVARAIQRSRIPVLSAIGHESDTTISDYVADLFAPTPSIAAERVVKQGMTVIDVIRNSHSRLIDRMTERIETAKTQTAYTTRLLVPPSLRIGAQRDRTKHLTIRLHQALDRQIEERKARLQRSREGLAHLNPGRQLNDVRRRLIGWSEALVQAGSRLIDDRKAQLQKQMVRLHLLSPLNILGRGYSITRKPGTLEIVRRAEDVAVGDPVQIMLYRGRLICAVEEKEEPS
ncbi:MAG: exodeoxyribonuclease VII large subunit [Nitrospiria bacterium]